jgi:NADH:ubiquinone oxidoreductase subunit E
MDLTRIEEILEKWGRDPDYAIEILQDIQDAYRHLPDEVMIHVADALGVPVGRLYHIGSFFKAFSFEPRGEKVLQVCMGTACHVKGAPRVLDALARELEIDVGGTTADGKFSLEPVRCLGCCGLAPVVMVDDDVHAQVSAASAAKIVRRYRDGRAGREAR